MATIYKFPTKGQRSWLQIERSLRGLLADAAAPTDMQDEIVSRMRAAYERYQSIWAAPVVCSLPDSLGYSEAELFETIAKQFELRIQDAMNELLFDRLAIEIELFQASRA